MVQWYLTPEKENKLHDDRSYCAALLGWFLSEKRAERIRNKKRPSSANMLDQFKIRAPQNPNSLFN